jgi:hypothetical protein
VEVRHGSLRILVRRLIVGFSGFAGFHEVVRLMSISDYTPTLMDVVRCPPVEFFRILSYFDLPDSRALSLISGAVALAWNIATYGAVAAYILRLLPGLPATLRLRWPMAVAWTAVILWQVREAAAGGLYALLCVGILIGCTRF